MSSRSDPKNPALRPPWSLPDPPTRNSNSDKRIRQILSSIGLACDCGTSFPWVFLYGCYGSIRPPPHNRTARFIGSVRPLSTLFDGAFLFLQWQLSRHGRKAAPIRGTCRPADSSRPFAVPGNDRRCPVFGSPGGRAGRCPSNARMNAQCRHRDQNQTHAEDLPARQAFL